MQTFMIEIEAADKDAAKVWTKIGELGAFARVRSVETVDKGPDDAAAATSSGEPPKKRGRPPKQQPPATGAPTQTTVPGTEPPQVAG